MRHGTCSGTIEGQPRVVIKVGRVRRRLPDAAEQHVVAAPVSLPKHVRSRAERGSTIKLPRWVDPPPSDVERGAVHGQDSFVFGVSPGPAANRCRIFFRMAARSTFNSSRSSGAMLSKVRASRMCSARRSLCPRAEASP